MGLSGGAGDLPPWALEGLQSSSSRYSSAPMRSLVKWTILALLLATTSMAGLIHDAVEAGELNKVIALARGANLEEPSDLERRSIEMIQ
jgi:hypothetical protein